MTMSSITSPLAGNGSRAMASAAQHPTSPMSGAFAAGAPTAETIAAVQSGVATQYWDECLSYPPGITPSLWLLVDGAWRAHENANPTTRDMVQRAFLGSGSTVQVWYDGGKVVGLVVSG
jgi:hypothetical protein